MSACPWARIPRECGISTRCSRRFQGGTPCRLRRRRRHGRCVGATPGAGATLPRRRGGAADDCHAGGRGPGAGVSDRLSYRALGGPPDHRRAPTPPPHAGTAGNGLFDAAVWSCIGEGVLAPHPSHASHGPLPCSAGEGSKGRRPLAEEARGGSRRLKEPPAAGTGLRRCRGEASLAVRGRAPYLATPGLCLKLWCASM